MSESKFTGRLKSSTSIPSTRNDNTAGMLRGSWMKICVKICGRESHTKSAANVGR